MTKVISLKFKYNNINVTIKRKPQLSGFIYHYVPCFAFQGLLAIERTHKFQVFLNPCNLMFQSYLCCLSNHSKTNQVQVSLLRVF